jgi:hypothetical protein
LVGSGEKGVGLWEKVEGGAGGVVGGPGFGPVGGEDDFHVVVGEKDEGAFVGVLEGAGGGVSPEDGDGQEGFAAEGSDEGGRSRFAGEVEVEAFEGRGAENVIVRAEHRLLLDAYTSRTAALGQEHI